MDKNELVGIFTRAGNRYGYDDVKAMFVECSDLRIRWTRKGKSVEFWVTDYLEEAPEDVLESLARTVFIRMKDDAESPYSDELLSYLTTDSFRERYRPIYLSRMTNASASPIGRFKNLSDSADRLVSKGYLAPLDDVYIGWLTMVPGDSCGHVSPLMRCAFVNSRLDNPRTTNEMLDFCLYMQLLKIEQGFDPLHSAKNATAFREHMNNYPNSEKMIAKVSEMGLTPWKGLSPEC